MIPAAYDPTAPVDIDLFAGPGGWDQGILPLGLRPLGFEWDALACRTARAAGHWRHQGDIAALHPLDIVRGYTTGGVRGQISSPPCQGFSPAGKGAGRVDAAHLLDGLRRLAAGGYGSLRSPKASGEAADRLIADLHQHMTDDRSVLALEPLRWALWLRPEWLAWEQVVPVLPLWEACAEVLRAVGYHVATGVLNAEQYGVPQTRRRAILAAHRDRPVSLPAPTHSRYHARTPGRLDDGVLPWVSMAQALTWGMTHRPYPTVAAGTAAGGTDPAAIGGSGARRIIRDELVAGRWVGSDGYGRDAEDVRRWIATAAVPGDTSWSERRPSPTIVGSFRPDIVAAPGWRKAGDGPRQAQPGSIRVTVAEAAVLQSFPADYPWQGNSTAQYRQVGDAVPPLLAHAIVSAILEGR